MLQWYFQVPLPVIIVAFISFGIAFLLFLFLPIALRFKLRPLQGLVIQLLLVSLGSWVTWQKDARHSQDWYGNHYREGSYLVVRIEEPLTEKNKTFKAEGAVEAILDKGIAIPVKGKLLLYFSKDSVKAALNYGDRVLIHKTLQAIKNSGNPGAFDYRSYAAFQGIFHQVFLKQQDWAMVEGININPFRQFIFLAREKILAILRNTIHTGKDELGIAEALLIGYTDDLDKDLVQAYSNTGVVHIIAISGMHLGLIYALLLWLIKRIPLLNRFKILQLLMILTGLWLFAILTGAAPSVLRAAVMFSFIATGKYLFKQGSIFNSLALSAFVLLCYNPYYLWAVGFQLSYLAVLGIVIFQKPIYHCFYLKNIVLDKAWQLMSVSTAAQLLTFPVCIYYFHQFPNLFLFTNMVAVPLAIAVLYTALVLAAFSWVPYAGIYLGKLVGGLTWCMNTFILWVNELPFALWDKIPATVLSTWLLYATVAGAGAWLIQKNKNYFKWALAALLVFVLQNTFYRWQTFNQQQLIIYNIPRQQAMDMVKGNRYRFIGDSTLLQDGFLHNFHLKPARIKQRLTSRADSLEGIFNQGMFYRFNDKKILIIDRPVSFDSLYKKIEIDLLVISRNPTLDLFRLTKTFSCKQVVFDASNNTYKIEKWMAACRKLQLNCYAVPASGAYIYPVGT